MNSFQQITSLPSQLHIKPCHQFSANTHTKLYNFTLSLKLCSGQPDASVSGSVSAVSVQSSHPAPATRATHIPYILDSRPPQNQVAASGGMS